MDIMPTMAPNFPMKTFDHFAIKLTLSPALSLWSNGGNERRHAVVDVTVKKILEDNPEMKIEKAVEMACYCRNIEIGLLGFSPQQITFGVGSHIPGNTDGNIATDSEAIREHFQLFSYTRKAYLEADSSARIKKIIEYHPIMMLYLKRVRKFSLKMRKKSMMVQ